MRDFFLTNTLSHEKELFRPVHPGHVGMYVCGPTASVKEHIHIGFKSARRKTAKLNALIISYHTGSDMQTECLRNSMAIIAHSFVESADLE